MTGMYYTPKKLECQVNIMVAGLDCKSRTSNANDWCENCKEKYLKVADPASGTGAFLKHAADGLSNPPYAFQHSTHLTAFGVRLAGVLVGLIVLLAVALVVIGGR